MLGRGGAGGRARLGRGRRGLRGWRLRRGLFLLVGFLLVSESVGRCETVGGCKTMFRGWVMERQDLSFWVESCIWVSSVKGSDSKGGRTHGHGVQRVSDQGHVAGGAQALGRGPVVQLE